MFGRMLSKLFSGGKSVLTIIGGYTTVRYTYDSMYETYYTRYKRCNIEMEIKNVVLTEKDKAIIQEFAGSDLTEDEMKRLKYDFLNRRRKQKLENISGSLSKEMNEKLYGNKIGLPENKD